MSDLGGFLVSVNVLEKKLEPVKMFKIDLTIPVANGFVIIGKGEEVLELNADNFELVTIYTLNEIISKVEEAVKLNRTTYNIELIEKNYTVVI